jgi:hypothetical protein
VSEQVLSVSVAVKSTALVYTLIYSLYRGFVATFVRILFAVNLPRDSEAFQELVATKYYDDQLDFEAVKQLVGAETAQRLRLLKADLEDEPLDLAAPDDVDVYDGDATSVETATDDDR